MTTETAKTIAILAGFLLLMLLVGSTEIHVMNTTGGF